jgi:hypothetical protein
MAQLVSSQLEPAAYREATNVHIKRRKGSSGSLQCARRNRASLHKATVATKPFPQRVLEHSPLTLEFALGSLRNSGLRGCVNQPLALYALPATRSCSMFYMSGSDQPPRDEWPLPIDRGEEAPVGHHHCVRRFQNQRPGCCCGNRESDGSFN